MNQIAESAGGDVKSAPWVGSSGLGGDKTGGIWKSPPPSGLPAGGSNRIKPVDAARLSPDSGNCYLYFLYVFLSEILKYLKRVYTYD